MQGSDQIPRARLLAQIERALREAPIAVLRGARQVGKTTLARQLSSLAERVHHFDLERPVDRERLTAAYTVLDDAAGLVVIDEIQRLPALFELLRPLADRQPSAARFLLLGSASPTLVRGVSESLAGRCQFVDLGGFTVDEVGDHQLGRLWLRGGFPRSYLAETDAASARWRDDFLASFLERDLPQLGNRVPAEAMRRFWTMLAHRHGQLWNASELGYSLGRDAKTARHYLDLLTGAYVLRVLQPWFENLGKRQRKSPKVYVRDSGLLHVLLGIETLDELQGHPKCGFSWEGFAMEQVLALTGERQAWFWNTQSGAELDLLLFRGGRRLGVEFKMQDAPGMTKSLHIALADLKLDQVWVVYPGSRRYRIHERVEVLPLAEVPAEFGAVGEASQPA